MPMRLIVGLTPNPPWSQIAQFAGRTHWERSHHTPTGVRDRHRLGTCLSSPTQWPVDLFAPRERPTLRVPPRCSISRLLPHSPSHAPAGRQRPRTEASDVPHCIHSPRISFETQLMGPQMPHCAKIYEALRSATHPHPLISAVVNLAPPSHFSARYFSVARRTCAPNRASRRRHHRHARERVFLERVLRSCTKPGMSSSDFLGLTAVSSPAIPAAAA